MQSAEDQLIAKYWKPLARAPGALGLVDDAAVLTPPPGHDLILTVDALVEGVHFFAQDNPETVARKALRVNLSDLAAKGASPAGCLLTLALRNDIGDEWISGFAKGLGADIEDYRCPLLGGDTVRTPGPVTISITAFGLLPQGTMVKRSGARKGDRVCVTGTIGDGALGLLMRNKPDEAARWALEPAMREHLAKRYLLPEPRTALAEIVRSHATSAMDVSDGLAGDLAKLCRASGVTAIIAADLVPLSVAARKAVGKNDRLIETILSGGDDYEIICTISSARLDSFLTSCQSAGTPAVEIGEIQPMDEAPLFYWKGVQLRLANTSFSHF